MVAVSHWYTSVVTQGFIIIMLTMLLLILAAIPVLAQFVFSKRRLAYEIRAAAPLIQAPMDVSKDLKVLHDNTALNNPYFAELRLVNRGHKDIPSEAFDQGMPIRFDLGIKIVKLLQIALIPDELPAPRVKTDGSMIEIGPSLIRKSLELNIALLADGPGISLTCHNPLIDIKIRPAEKESSKVWLGLNLKTVLGWAALAFVIWWVIEQPAAAAHLAHNIRTFLSNAAKGLANFFASI